MRWLKKALKGSVNQIGYDFVRTSQIPRHTFMGLGQLPINTVIDIGSHKGEFAGEISLIFPKAQLFCFEPQPDRFQELLIWAKATNGKVQVFNLAVGERNAKVEFFQHNEHTTSSSLLKTTEVEERLFPFTQKQSPIWVNQTTLDDWYKKYSPPIKPEIFIKIDVQGYEDRVIQGGLQVFGMSKVCMLEINVASLYEGQASHADIVNLLHQLDYRYIGNFEQAYTNSGEVLYLDAVFLKK